MSNKNKTKTTKAATSTAKMTQKQAVIQAGNILRGLDNSISVGRRRVEEMETLRTKVSALALGLSNMTSTATVAAPKASKPEPKKAPPSAPKAGGQKATPKASKPAVKAAAPKASKPQPTKKDKASAKKDKAPAKPSAPKPAVSKPAQSKSAKSAAAIKEPVDGRPNLRDATKEIIRESGPGTRKSVYDRVTSKYGYWSKQSFYNLIKDDGDFKSENDILDLVSSKAKKADSDLDLVSKVEQDRSTAAVV